MKLNVNLLNNETGTFVVKTNNQEFVVDPMTTRFSVDLSSNNANEIEIIEKPQDRPSWVSWLVWILTLPLQGIINAIISYGDDMWYDKINPYLMVAKMSFSTVESSAIDISFSTGRKHQQWECTNVYCKQAESVWVDSRPYPNAIYASYIGYLKKVISISSIGIALFVFLLCKMIAASNASGILACTLLIAFFGVWDVVLAITQYFKARTLYARFTENH